MLYFIAINWLWFSAITLFFITLLSLTPLPQLPAVPGSDKLHHLVSYALLAFPVALASIKQTKWLLAAFIVWSGSIELIQPYVNRYGEWLDLLANTLGLLTGVLLAYIMRYLFYEDNLESEQDKQR